MPFLEVKKEVPNEEQQGFRRRGDGSPQHRPMRGRRWAGQRNRSQEVVAKVREAASTLSKTGDVAQFQQKQAPWVWKDTYIFVEDCDKKVQAAHPIKPELVGTDFVSLKDTKGKTVFPADFCDAAKKPSGVWFEYWWPKPGEKEGSRKLAYGLSAKGTPFVVAAGVYDDKVTIKEVSKQSSMK